MRLRGQPYARPRRGRSPRRRTRRSQTAGGGIRRRNLRPLRVRYVRLSAPEAARTSRAVWAAGVRHRRLRRRRPGAACAYGASSGHLARPEYRLAPPAREAACPRPRLRPSSAPARAARPRPLRHSTPTGKSNPLRVAEPQVRRRQRITDFTKELHPCAEPEFPIFNFQSSVFSLTGVIVVGLLFIPLCLTSIQMCDPLRATGGMPN